MVRKGLQVIGAAGIAGALLWGVVALTPIASAQTAEQIQAQIQSLLRQVAALQEQLRQLQGGGQSTPPTPPTHTSSNCPSLYRALGLGATGEDVRQLQQFLIANGYLQVSASGYFGYATQSAVIRFQSAVGLSPVGIVGPMTRTAIQSRCSNVSDPQPTSGSLDANPSSGQAPLTVDFTYRPGSDDTAEYYIEFGDGNAQKMDRQQIYCIRAPCPSPSVAKHTYTERGTYTAVVTRYVACLYSNPRCMIAVMPLAKATITVGGSSSNHAPTISSFSGPTTLSINQTGTWTIQASDPDNQNLSYHITWGDENQSPMPTASMASDAFVQTTTFSHTYGTSGTYTISITVRDQSGLEAKTTTTVRVGSGGTVCTAQYDPVCGRPKGCMNTCPPGMYCTMMCQMYPAQTYGNRCQLDSENADYLHAGACTSYDN